MNKDLQRIVNILKYEINLTSLLLKDRQEVILYSTDDYIPFQFRMIRLKL